MHPNKSLFWLYREYDFYEFSHSRILLDLYLPSKARSLRLWKRLFLNGLLIKLVYSGNTKYRYPHPYRWGVPAKIKFRVHKAPLRKEVELRITPNEVTGVAEVRIWYKDTLTEVYQIKNPDLNLVRF